MNKAIQSFYRDDRGVVAVMVGAVLALLLLFSVYAIDTSQMLLVRTQLQNAADAGVLNAILELGLTGDTATAVAAGILAAGANNALQQVDLHNTMAPVGITAADVTFPEEGIIRVTTHRTKATNDNYLTYFMRVFADDGEIGEMTAFAEAQFNWVCGGSCIKPWAPPDRWFDADSNNLYNEDGGDFYDPIGTGYTDADLGDQITLVLGNPSNATHDFGQFWYYSINFPPLNKPEAGNPETGADVYRDWICLECRRDDFTVGPGDIVQVEPGGMVGPNGQGLRCLIDTDPDARWEDGEVVNSAFPISPRIIRAALFDPTVGLQTDMNGRKTLTITKIMVIFVEQQVGNQQIVGRFMRLADADGEVCEDQSTPTFLFRTALTR